MANSIPISGASAGAGGNLLPSPLVDAVVQQIQRNSGALDLVDTAATNSRKEVIPVYKGRPAATFVTEGSAKPVDGAEFGTTTLNVKKIAVIVPFTDEILEDAQQDPAALVTPDVIAAIADLADAHIVGNGITSSFDSDLAGDAGETAALGADGDALKKAISSAMGKLEGNGYTPNGVLLGGDSRQAIRDARSEADNTTAIFDAADPFYGLRTGVSTNLDPITGSDDADVIGIVADWNYCRFRVRSDINLSVSNEAAYTQGGSLVSAFERNVTLLRWEMRAGFVITDANAVAKITGPAG
jgi:HK97 family phage major capsid protein